MKIQDPVEVEVTEGMMTRREEAGQAHAVFEARHGDLVEDV